MIYYNKSDLKNIISTYKNKSYVYVLSRNNGQAFYVGVGVNNRVFQHVMPYMLKNGNNKLKNNIIMSEIDKFGDILYSIILFNSDRNRCLFHEKQLIKKYGRFDNNGILANWTDGGDIGPVGLKLTDDQLLQKSICSRKNADAISITLKEYWKNLSEEDKISKTKHLDNTRNNESARIKIASATKSRWQNDEYREKVIEKQKKKQKELSSVHSKNMKEKWQDPVFREYMIKSRKAKKLAKEN